MLDNLGFQDEGHATPRSACEDYGANVAGHGRNRWIGNTVDGTTSDCLEIAQGVVGSEFVGNTLRRAGRVSGRGAPFELAGQDGQDTHHILIQGNTCESDASRPEGCSISGYGGHAYGITVQGNSFTGFGPGQAALVVVAGGAAGAVTIDDNEFGSGGGLWINDAGDGLLIRNNRFLPGQARTQPLLLLGGGSGHEVTGNTFEGAGSAVAIRIQAGGGHQVAGNTLSSVGTGIFCATAGSELSGNTVAALDAPDAVAVRLSGAGALRNQVHDNDLSGPTPALLENGADRNHLWNNQLHGGAVTVAPGAGPSNVIE